MVFNTRQKLFCFLCVFQYNPQISCFCFTFAFLLNTGFSFLPPGALILSCILQSSEWCQVHGILNRNNSMNKCSYLYYFLSFVTTETKLSSWKCNLPGNLTHQKVVRGLRTQDVWLSVLFALLQPCAMPPQLSSLGMGEMRYQEREREKQQEHSASGPLVSQDLCFVVPICCQNSCPGLLGSTSLVEFPPVDNHRLRISLCWRLPSYQNPGG